jgi:hypothetical protein
MRPKLMVAGVGNVIKDSMISHSEESRERMAALVEELNGESDRAVAVVGAAWVEESLQQAIESVLHPHDAAREKLFTGSGAITTFAAKIELACMFGFMTDAIRKDLHAIRWIRNRFAHVITQKATQAKLSFTEDAVRHRCLALNCIAFTKPTDPRVAFTRACAVLNNDFHQIIFMSGKVPDAGRVIAQGVDALT